MALHDLQYPKHYVGGEVYVKEAFLEHVGDFIVSHSHDYDHLSLLATGRVRVTVDGEVTEYGARSGILVKAGKEHKIEALEPNSLWYCVHKVPADLVGEDVLDAVVIRRG